MPASEVAFEYLANRIRETSDRAKQDGLLDIWIDYRDRATEWDAEQWGFNPDTWMLKERNMMYMSDLRERRHRWC